MAEDPESPPLQYGSCLCEAVKFSVSGESTLSYLCHCRNCQKLTGTAFAANRFYQRSNFKILKGEDKLHVYKCDVTGSGNITNRHSCSNCGSPLFTLPDSKPEIIVVASGSLDNFDDPSPMQEVFVKDRKTWMTAVDGAEIFQKARPPMSGRK